MSVWRKIKDAFRAITLELFQYEKYFTIAIVEGELLINLLVDAGRFNSF